MAEKTIPELTLLTSIDRAADLFEVSDTSDSGNSKRTTINSMLNVTSQPASIDDIQTLTNKTLTAPAISSPVLSGTITGTYTLGGTPTFPSAVATLTGSQNLTNKVLTSPTINSPTITNPTITVDTISEYTSANGVVIDGVTLKDSKMSGTHLTDGTVGSAALATNAVQGNQLATSAIKLGYASITSGTFSTSSATVVQVTGLGVTVTVPSGGRGVKISVFANSVYNSTITTNVIASIWDGTVGSGTQIARAVVAMAAANQQLPLAMCAFVTPSAGSKTYNVGLLANGGGTANLTNDPTYPAFILVEAI